MSHVAICKTEPGKPLIVDLEAVKLAALNLGLKCEERKTYRWWGHSVGDYPIPEGYTAEELGKNAVLVLSVPLETAQELGLSNVAGFYELAIIEDKKNPGCYLPMYDFYGQQERLDRIIGSPVRDEKNNVTAIAPKFMMHYRMCADALSAQEVGDQIDFEEQADGSWTSIVRPNEERLRR